MRYERIPRISCQRLWHSHQQLWHKFPLTTSPRQVSNKQPISASPRVTKTKAGKRASLPGLVPWHSQLAYTIRAPKQNHERKQATGIIHQPKQVDEGIRTHGASSKFWRGGSGCPELSNSRGVPPQSEQSLLKSTVSWHVTRISPGKEKQLTL